MWKAPVKLHAGIDTMPGPDASGRPVLGKELDLKPVFQQDLSGDETGDAGADDSYSVSKGVHCGGIGGLEGVTLKRVRLSFSCHVVHKMEYVVSHDNEQCDQLGCHRLIPKEWYHGFSKETW